MIGQRAPKLTLRQEREAYAAATERDKGRCVRCGTNAPTHRDHRQNRDAYNTTPANLQLLCAIVCHPWKNANPAAAMRDGFAVSRFEADPASVPAYRYGVGWVIYLNEPDDDGNWWRMADEPKCECCSLPVREAKACLACVLNCICDEDGWMHIQITTR